MFSPQQLSTCDGLSQQWKVNSLKEAESHITLPIVGPAMGPQLMTAHHTHGPRKQEWNRSSTPWAVLVLEGPEDPDVRH